MALYNFTLTLSGVTARTVGLEDALHAAGCADALVCFYGTAVYLEFDRERDSLEQAILSAIADIESASALNARVESVDSALVGLSDIAEDSPLVAHATVLDNLNLALQLRATPESTTVLRYLRGFENQPRACPTVT